MKKKEKKLWSLMNMMTMKCLMARKWMTEKMLLFQRIDHMGRDAAAHVTVI